MKRAITVLALAAVAALALTWPLGLQHWLAVHTGTVNEPGPYYGFFSGFGSDLSELALAGGVIGLLRKHNCHVHGCWRIGRHPVEGTPYLVCARHHPEGPVTHERILAAHHRHRDRQEAVTATVKRIRTQPRDQPPSS